MDYYKASLKLHAKHKGKIEIISRVPLKTRQDLSLAYTPGVAEPCRKIHQNPKKVYKYTRKGNLVAVISDGSAVLGLGNIGPLAALPVMEGKAILFKEFGGVDAFPICLDTQDTEEIIATVKRIAPGFGGINLEDISAPRCFEIEERLIKELDIPVFHDDQHGTAVVVLAALINALKVTGQSLKNLRITMNGAGAGAIAVSKLLIRYGADSQKMILCDTHGAIYRGRKEGMNPFKKKMASITNAAKLKGPLAKAMKGAHLFIGLTKAKLVTSTMVKGMAKNPIIFAMANPEPEIMPDLAKKAGAKIVATGRSDFPNQINNVLAFPGIFRGVLDAGIRRITDEIKIAAAEAIARCVKKPTAEKIIPTALDKRVAKAVAKAIKTLK